MGGPNSLLFDWDAEPYNTLSTSPSWTRTHTVPCVVKSWIAFVIVLQVCPCAGERKPQA